MNNNRSTTRKYAARFAATVGAVVLTLAAAGAVTAHADTSQATDACLNGITTVISGMPCSAETPPVALVCATGIAHATNGPDYCPAPRTVIVGEYELGTAYVPKLADETRLDVAMRRTSLQSMRFRCARLGGSRLVVSHGFNVCRGVDHGIA